MPEDQFQKNQHTGTNSFCLRMPLPRRRNFHPTVRTSSKESIKLQTDKYLLHKAPRFSTTCQSMEHLPRHTLWPTIATFKSIGEPWSEGHSSNRRKQHLRVHCLPSYPRRQGQARAAWSVTPCIIPAVCRHACRAARTHCNLQWRECAKAERSEQSKRTTLKRICGRILKALQHPQQTCGKL